MKNKETSSWKEIKTILYGLAIVFIPMGVYTIVDMFKSQIFDMNWFLASVVVIVIGFIALYNIRYIVPPENGEPEPAKPEEPKEETEKKGDK